PTLVLYPSFFFIWTATTEIYTLSLHDALPISDCSKGDVARHHITACNLQQRLGHGFEIAGQRSGQHQLAGLAGFFHEVGGASARSEEHTSELQSRENLVCRLLLEKKKNKHT